jgi:hypothetical protein
MRGRIDDVIAAAHPATVVSAASGLVSGMLNVNARNAGP